MDGEEVYPSPGGPIGEDTSAGQTGILGGLFT
jgi:hypothetical protein